MHTFLKSLLITSTLFFTIQQSHAEQIQNVNGQPPIWNFGQTPIAWGDCVPVPVVPVPYQQNNMGMNQLPIPQPMMQPFSFPMPMNEAPIILPPPSPFFNPSPVAPIPMPVTPNIAQVACDDSALKALQAKYNQGASASKNKIKEITQALNDSNNQMADARVIIENLTKQSDTTKSKLTSDISMLEMQLTNISNTNKSLQAKLTAAESSAGNQKRKINALSQSTTELIALKSAYKDRSNENSELKKQLANLDNANKSLQIKLSTVESNASTQARKITVLNQSTAELAALQSTYKIRNNENAALKKQLAELKNKNISIQTLLTSAESNAGSQARKLTSMSQSTAELIALKSAYKDRNAESASLKKKLGELDNAYKKLQAQLTKAQSDASTQTRKLTVLGQSAAELTAIQSAYKVRGEENAKLKKMLADLDNSYKSLQTQFSLATKDASAQARKLTILGQSATELTAIQSAYKEKLNQNIALKAQLAELESLKTFADSCRSEVSECGMKLTNTDNQRKSLLGKIATLETIKSNQTRKIAALMATTNELDALKSAYKDLSSKKVELSSKLSVATADTDNDGVLDSNDKCPNSAPNTEVNGFGCLADMDKDGVVDSKDNCPTSPAGSSVNEQGCPRIIDTDGDSVADASDLCPTTPAGTKVNEFGCEPTQNITLDGVNFATGSARLTPNSLPILTAAAKTLNNNSSLNVEISGYTDNQGLAYLNKRLSQRRANSVMIQLIKDGVDANRLSAKGYGEKNPIASNRTANGRATNRRVELKIRK